MTEDELREAWGQLENLCWWSDLPKETCGHCLGQCDTEGNLIE